MFSSMNVVIGGGTGFVGRHLVNSLKNKGAKVQIISRHQNRLLDRLSWKTIEKEGLPKGTDTVINLAGRNILDINPWTKTFKKEIYDSRIKTNQVLVKAIYEAEEKPKCFINISGVGYYEPSKSMVYTEDWVQPEETSVQKKDFLMKLAHDWEISGQLNSDLAPSTRRVIIRSGVVIGPDGGIIGNLKNQFKFGLGASFGDGQQWFPWIHVDDLVGLFEYAIKNQHVIGAVNGVAPELVRNKDFTQAFGKAVNRLAIIETPAFLVKLMFNPERADLLLKGQCVKSRAEELGFRYKFPKIFDACRASVEAK